MPPKKTAKVLDNYFEDVSRSGMFFEGFGIDHLHSKIFPMHGTADLKNWQPIENKKVNTYFKNYPGYLSSNDSLLANETELAELATNIRNSQK